MVVLFCLHGWGGSSASFQELRQALAQADITLFTPDLPGFGTEPEPTRAWTVDDYATWVEAYIEASLKKISHHEKITVLLLGHSHGGRIAIKLAHRKNVRIDHLYLCAAAGIRHPRHVKRMVGLTLAKTGSLLLSLPGISALRPLAKRWLYKLVRVHY